MVVCSDCGLHSTSGRMYTPGCAHCEKRVEIVLLLEQILADPDAARLSAWQRLEEMGMKSGYVH